MALIDLKTNLKDLKFGNDELGGGNSGQPYVQTPIPAADEALPLGTGGPDFLVRGGTLLPTHIVDDEKRLTKFFKSTNGILFTVKQNLLSRVAVKTQASPPFLNEGVYTPISTLLEAAGNPLGIHVNKQGLNPFGGVLGLTTYSSIVVDKIEPESTNRLVLLSKNKIYNTISSNPLTTQISANPLELLSYGGGPNSVLGIGNTNISFATNNVGVVVKTSDATKDYTLDPQQLDEISKIAKTQGVVDFRKNLKTKIFSSAPSYNPGDKKTLEVRTNLGDPGDLSLKNIRSYTNGYTEDKSISYGAASPNSYDRINALPIYKSDSTKTDSDGNLDTINFYIKVLDNDKPTIGEFIHFRAFLNTITDTYNSAWNATKYIGRGENFYNYTGFDRKISLSWTVAAQSRVEMKSMYNKLNFLASVCTPDYSEAGYMRGNLVELTVGDLFYQQVGVITGFSYEMNDENSSWEIGIDDDGYSIFDIPSAPHLVKVNSFEFLPIHNFVPRKQKNVYQAGSEDSKLLPITYGQERFIASNSSIYDPDNINPNVDPNKQDAILLELKGLQLPNTTALPSANPNTGPATNLLNELGVRGTEVTGLTPANGAGFGR